MRNKTLDAPLSPVGTYSLNIPPVHTNIIINGFRLKDVIQEVLSEYIILNTGQAAEDVEKALLIKMNIIQGEIK